MKTVFCAAILFAAPAAAETLTYDIYSGDDDVGDLVVERDGMAYKTSFDVKNNGRGPTINETLVLDDRGYPQRLEVSGNTTFGNQVDEWFRVEGGKALWQDATGEGSADVDGAPDYYIDQNASPYTIAALARALLADADGAIDVYPGGTATIRQRDTQTYEGPDGPVEATTYEISGLSMDPVPVTLDADGELFALASSRSILVRRGYQAADEPLRSYVEQLSTERFVDIQKDTAHSYDGPVRIRNVRIFDPERLGLTEPRDVVVFGERIASVQPANSPVTEGETIIDGAGGTLVPGMYEMHGHFDQASALLNLVAGITSVRDMGNENDVLAGLIERIDAGVIAGPRITRSCFIEGESEFASRTGETVSTLEEGLDMVRWCAARGFHQVKLYNSMKGEWAPTLVEEAHRLGLKVAGHVPAFSTANDMIAAGFDELTHVNQIALGWVLEEGEDTRTLLRLTALDRLPGLNLNGAEVRRTIDSMVAKGIAHDPTITIHENLLASRNGEVSPSFTAVVDHMPVSVQREYRTGWVDASDPATDEAYRGAFQQIIAMLTKMHDAGIFLVPGTDMGGSFSFHRELELFEELGMTPAEVLRRATLDMAAYLGQDEDLGSIETGKYADFFLIPGDPTVDLSAIRQGQMVVANGSVYFPSEIYPRFGIRPFAEAPNVIRAE